MNQTISEMKQEYFEALQDLIPVFDSDLPVEERFKAIDLYRQAETLIELFDDIELLNS